MIKLIIAVDFDATMAEEVYPEPGIGDPVPGAFHWVRRFREAGATLMLWTVRHGVLLEDAVAFLDDYDFKFDYINESPVAHGNLGPKKHADIYIDDKAFGVPLMPSYMGRRPCVDWEKVGPSVLNIIEGGPYGWN